MVVISCTKVGLRVKNCSCVKISENVLVFGHYAINLHKGVAQKRTKSLTFEYRFTVSPESIPYNDCALTAFDIFTVV